MFLRQLDLLSPKITLYYKRKIKHASIISGILTIFTFISIFGFALYYIIRCINRENPTAYFFNRYVDDIGTFSFKNLNFFNYIQLIEGRERKIKDIDLNKIEILAIDVPMESFMNIRDFDKLNHWLYGKCDNKIDVKNIKDLLNTEKFYKSACLKKFYKGSESKYYDINDNNFEWPIISHGSSHPESKVFGVIIKKCLNTSTRLKYFGPCSPENEINNYIKSTTLSFTIIDHYVDVLNYKNPISQFLFTINNVIKQNSFTLNNLNFYPGLVKSYDNLFTEKTVEQTAYTFYQNQQITTNLENTEYLGAFYLWVQNTQQYYERRYHKLTEVLTEIGGIANALMIIFQFINYLIYRFNLLSDTKDLISDVLKKNNSVYDNLRKSKSIKEFLEINKQSDNLTIKGFETDKNIKRFKFSDNLDEEKEENNKIINKRINVINSNLGEETNRINKNHEDSKENIFTKQQSNIYEKFASKRSKSIIKHNYSVIENKSFTFNCFSYLCYLIFCRQINSHMKHFEDLRRLIISEETMFNNYFNVYKLLELNKGNFN